MTAAELAEKLERLDALFVELYNYAESQSLSDTMSKSGANALRAIKGSIGNRYNVIPQAAARLRSMEEALKEAHEAINLAMTIAQGRFPATARKAPLEVLADAERKARAALAGAVRTSRKTLSGEGQ